VWVQGTVNGGTSTVSFKGNQLSQIWASGMAFNNVHFQKNTMNTAFKFTLNTDLDINGDFSVNLDNGQTIDGNTIRLAGNLIGTSVKGGTANLVLDGTSLRGLC
jgi:hypothetical protein